MKRRWVVLSLIFSGIVINYIDRGNLSIAAPSMMRDFHISPATMGVLLSAFFWTYGLFQIPAGAVVDRFGIRRAYTGAFLVWSLASAGIALSRGVADVAALRLALGLAEAIAPLASIAFIRKNFAGKDQGLPTAIYIAGQNVGPALGALVGAALLDLYGWRLMFAITGLGAIIWLPGWLAAVPADERKATPAVDELPGDLAPSPCWSWGMFVASPTFWFMSIAVWLASYYWYFVLTWVPSYLILSRGFSITEMGHVVSAALFIMAFTNVAAGWVVDRWAASIGVFRARVRFAVAGYLGTGVILLLPVARERFWALPILAVAMCATGIGNSNFWAISQHVPPSKMVGRTIGYLNTVSVAGGAVAPIITGFILGPQKHFGPAIFVAGMCAVCAGFSMAAAGAQGLEHMKESLSGASAGSNLNGVYSQLR